MFVAAVLLALWQAGPSSPLDFGRRALAEAAMGSASHVSLAIHPNGRREEYRIDTRGGRVTIVGSDANGAMYGALEFAERLHHEGNLAWSSKTITGKPYLADRGVNLFLTLPWNYVKNDTDYDVAALTDPHRWWFHNEDYWRTLLDLMAKSRLNWLDIHGAWDISSTGAPNLYAYFVTSPTFPLVGVPPDVKARDLAQLNHVIEMAHARGIRVSLMCYEANLRIPQNPKPPYEGSEENVYVYTREVVERMIRGAPGLDAIGFRIGESGHRESFFRCYQEAVKQSGREIPLITRSWITTKQNVLPLARASRDFTVEIKYNGEQWGAPYPVMGGRMANWGSYSFQDYFSDSGAPGKNARNWPGCPADGGGAWPSQPYKVVWQVRANGTHRIFPFYNPNWVRRSITAMRMGTVSGYTVEGLDAYFPKSPDYYLANPSRDKYCDWIHQRDELWWMTWGRLGYDPTLPDATLDDKAKELGLDSGLIGSWEHWSIAASQALMGYALGPDHRDHAPELEWGGNTDAFVHVGGLDSFSFISPDEDFANMATGGLGGRVNRWALGWYIGNPFWSLGPQTPLAPFAVSHYADARRREIENASVNESCLGLYYAARFMGAYAAAAYASANGSEVRYGLLRTSLGSMIRPLASYHLIGQSEDFGQDPYRKPFTDKLRMHTNNFSWVSEHSKVVAEQERLQSLPQFKVAATVHPYEALGARVKLTWHTNRNFVVGRVEGSGFKQAWLLVKPLPSSAFWHRIAMKRVLDSPEIESFEVEFPRERFGYAIAAEVSDGRLAARYPNPLEETPYRVIPAQSGPTPQIYDSGEAPPYFNPAKVHAAAYGGMLVGTRAEKFFRQSTQNKRKLLPLVAQGLRLVILQEDFIRRKLDWLPRPLTVRPGVDDAFDPAGAYGLAPVRHPHILEQVFVPAGGWEVLGNGGLARMRYGRGEILVTTARVMQFMEYPDAARAFVALLSLGGKQRPTILVDSCSEAGSMTSSCHPDLMNSHGIPFLTLGEVIANEQGMNSFTPVAGPRLDDDVLEGKGTAIANAFLKSQVQAAAHRADPPTREAFEVERARRKHELMRCLGLEPMPARTPLNARITGTIARPGYRVEKLVFESRPRFFVTAHVYVPDHARGRLPVIVHVNGHWAHKKDEDRIQLRCAFCALQGYLAIAIDSPGHSFEGNALIERRAEGDHNDFALVEGGTCATGYYVWDAIRALDYVATRPDADMSRVGITGASGGGLATLYAFAADDRYRAAVPVVYMASMELAPDNGCLCNHVPGTLRIGDRSDVLAIQAPKPVYLMGAQDDGEFPPEATRLTHRKLQPIWSLFGRAEDTYVQIFAGGHDYNQPMREAMIGFFNRYVKGVGDGKPAPQPTLDVIDPEDRQLLAFDPPAPEERTMRELAIESLDHAAAAASAEEAIAVNGGRPARTPLNYREQGTGSRRFVTFEPEPGLVTPAILSLPDGPVRGVRIVASDQGKTAEGHGPVPAGFAQLKVDILGTGELQPFEMRYAVYLGRSPAAVGGWQLARAAEAMRKYSPVIELVGDGPLSSQAAMFAGLLDDGFAKVTGLHGLQRWQDVFSPGVTPYAIQPRANLIGSLSNLRALVKHGEWLP